METQNTHLRLVDARYKKAKQREQEEEACKLTPAEVTARVREIRSCLEAFSNRLAGAQFDFGYDTPPSLQGMDNPYIIQLAERLNPSIGTYFDRISEHLPDEDDLQELKLTIGEVTFALGIMAGAMLHGASKHEIDRFEQGLIHATMSRHWQAKS